MLRTWVLLQTAATRRRSGRSSKAESLLLSTHPAGLRWATTREPKVMLHAGSPWCYPLMRVMAYQNGRETCSPPGCARLGVPNGYGSGHSHPPPPLIPPVWGVMRHLVPQSDLCGLRERGTRQRPPCARVRLGALTYSDLTTTGDQQEEPLKRRQASRLRRRKRRGSVSSPRHDTPGTEPIDIAAV